MSIVTTAISSFNNAALYSPSFFVIGLFSLTLFLMVFLYGNDFISKFGWSNRDVESKSGFVSVLCLMIWLLIFGGNYAVIRDSISLLPLMISVVLFVAMVFITNRMKQYKYLEKMRDKKSRWFLFLLLFVLAVFSSLPTWWGILLQLSAVLCGIIVGDRLHKNIPDMLTGIIILGMMTVLLLMQPEYFKFGQLGNLTIIHIIALLLCGFFCVTSLAAGYTNARAKIYKSAYIKLKWLCRIMSVLALILFVLTESVPVFIGLMTVCLLSESLTIYHGKNLPENVSKQSWALLLISFGIVIICPLISMIGILYLIPLWKRLSINDFIKLL